MKSKWNRIIIIILSAWFVVFAVDMVLVYLGLKPIFTISAPGGEVISFLGLGYRVDRFYPISDLSSNERTTTKVNALIYLLVNSAAIIYLILSRVARNRNKKPNKPF